MWYYSINIKTYIIVKQAAEKWGISERRIRVLCVQGKLVEPNKKGIVEKYLPTQIQIKGKYFINHRKKLDTRRPLTEGEVARLNEEFVVKYTYNSNTIKRNTLTLRETDLVLIGITIDKKPLDHMEVVGHKEAYDYVRELVKDNIPLSENY